MQEKEINQKGKRIFYRIKGEGHPLVLLHGFGEDGTVWNNQVDHLQGYKLIIPDLPGTGRSDMTEDMSMEGLADIVKDIILHETATVYFKEGQPESVIMIGHSMGGYITMAFVEKYHHMLKGFGLFHSSAFADSEEKKETRRKGIAFIQQHGPKEFLKTSIPNLYGPVTKENKMSLIEDHIKSAHNFSGAALVSYYVSMMERPDRSNLLKQTHLPVLFILGKYDMAVPLEDGLKQCFLPDNSYIHVLESSGHMGMIEEVGTSNQFLNEYLSGIN